MKKIHLITGLFFGVIFLVGLLVFVTKTNTLSEKKYSAEGAFSKSVEGLEASTGPEYEAKLTEQLKYIRRAETQLSGAGVGNASDSRVKELVVKTLTNDATILERI